MIHTFRHRQDVYRVTLAVDPDRSPPLIDEAVALGASKVFIVRARGVLHKRKWGPFTLPGISPSFDQINILVPGDRLMGVMGRLVAVGRLDHFGAGAIYATRVADLWENTEALFDETKPVPPEGDYGFQTDLVGIQCICQLDHAEEIAYSAMLAGSPSPTISYGYGHGIRDRLGPFLQLAINPKKELIELVVGSAEAGHIFEGMVEEGHLDKPARGFISTWPVDVGLINTVSYQQPSVYPATMEQIIRAIDQMQGNTLWRSTGTLRTAGASQRKKLTGLVSLTCIVNRGFGDLCSWAAMEAGASGTSTKFANALPVNTDGHSLDHSDERELIALTVGQGQVETVVRALSAVPELQGTPVIVFAHPAPEAVTYLK